MNIFTRGRVKVIENIFAILSRNNIPKMQKIGI